MIQRMPEEYGGGGNHRQFCLISISDNTAKDLGLNRGGEVLREVW